MPRARLSRCRSRACCRCSSELLPIEGADFVGTLPDDVQKVTTFSAGIAAESENPEAARELIACLGSLDAAPVIEATGLEPVQRK